MNLPRFDVEALVRSAVGRGRRWDTLEVLGQRCVLGLEALDLSGVVRLGLTKGLELFGEAPALVCESFQPLRRS